MREADSTRGRKIIYVLVPYDLAAALHEPLRRHFRNDPLVEVVVERRRAERRSGRDRREGSVSRGEGERREVLSESGRRIAERRAAAVPAEAIELPRRARRYADRICFIRRIEPSTEQMEDRDTARLVAQFQRGDREAFGILYSRYFERVFAYLRVLLRNRADAEDATQQVFTQVLEALPRYERREQPFRAWLFVSARNYALQYLRKEGRMEAYDPEELETLREAAEPPEEGIELPGWISDQDLLVLMERLPLTQRQTLTLRYLFGYSNFEIAEILGRSPESVRMLQSRATAFLRERLTTLGRAPRRHEPKAPTTRWPKQARVLRARRYSLADNGPAR